MAEIMGLKVKAVWFGRGEGKPAEKCLLLNEDELSALKVKVAREIFNDIFALCDNAEDKLDKLFTEVDEYRKGYENSVKHFKENMIKLQEKYTGEQ